MWWKTACFFRSHGGFSLSKLWRPLMHSWPPFYLWANGSRWCCTWMMSVGSPEIRLEVSRDLGDVLWNHSGDLKGFCCVATCYARAAQRTQLLKLLRQGFWSWTKLKPTVRDEHDGKKTKKNQTNLIFPAVWVWVMESTHRFLGQNTLSKWWNHRLWALPALESRQSKYYRRGVQGRRAGRLATPDMESFPIHWCH